MEEFFESESTILILAAGLVIFSLFFLFAKFKHASILEDDSGKNDLNSNLPIKKENAVVLSKIEPENPNGIFFGFAHIVFQTESGERRKLAIIDKSKYDEIIVGDHGVLSTKGNAFVSFEIVKVSESTMR